MIKLVFLLALAFSAKAVADDNCVRQVPKPLVVDKAKVIDYNITQPRTRELKEVFELESGQVVTILQYGCAHFGLTYKADFSVLSDDEIVSKAIGLLEKIKEVAPHGVRNVLKGLQSVEHEKLPPDVITINEGYDWVYLKSEPNRQGQTLVVSYDIAL